MRPINRGDIPKDSDGEDKKYSTYQKARGDLIKRIGDYCSYCEMQLDSSLAVEHVLPKKPEGAQDIDQERLLDWNNFLLACTNCNSNKGNEDVDLQDYVWPDVHNTFLALQYAEGGIVTASDSITSPLKERIEALIKLVGLDKRPPVEHEASDRRWRKRMTVWDKAVQARERLESCNIPQMREQIVDTATGDGYWSIWMTVFSQDSDMLRRLISASSFKGTDANCFDANGKPIVRIQGDI
ncbi:HNH endonuclease [Vibrio europaeus]|uniref:HNH endonuclease n=1 Tax=Vibrio europaeus TaxID=300876 RepID=UPI0018A7E08E|nr:HNH endonuclease signature motif containing protein [Vibrio europaeus]MDC5809272.1 HNH endonuclease [Vibrio europaeus]QPG36813.1 HNH endonuclease [Vibrio europaeus]